MVRAWMAAAVLAAGPAAAQTISAGDAAVADDVHTGTSAEIVVTAPFTRSRADLLSGTSVLTGADLAREIKPTIGETLARQPGVSSTSFGPNASRPVLRGFQGERIRVLTDGIGSFDVSNTSVDHAVAINPLTAERIEVLRGPSALLYGSSAIGGVVNVVDKRIPRRVPDEAAHVDALATYGSAADERSGGAAIDVPVGDKLVFHLDGSYLKTDDLDIGGFVLSDERRADAAASDDPEVAEAAELRGRLPNSAARTWDVAGGASILVGGGSLGFAVSRYESLYGVPARLGEGEAHEEGEEHEGEEEHEHGDVRLDIAQTRLDVRAEQPLALGPLETLRLRVGWADYEHTELEGDEIGTRFFNQALEGRVELVQARQGAWRGAVGGQLFARDFNVIGAEKFVPRNETVQAGLFTLQEFDFGRLKAEIGGRYERTQVDAFADDDLGNPDIERRFNAYSVSGGASYGLGGDWRAGVNLSRTERAPSAEELYANGPHAGTQAFEVGDPTFDKEKSLGVEAVLRGEGEGYSFAASAYHNWFDDYIYESETGEIEDELPVFQFLQDKARYYGFEVEGSLRLAQLGAFALSIDGVADYVRARIVGDGPAPRIPPRRLLGGVEAQSDALDGRVEVEWADAQDRVAGFETETDGFTLVNASLAWRPFGRDGSLTLLASANNIFDVDARRHASVLKDFAPLAGRDLRVTARVSF